MLTQSDVIVLLIAAAVVVGVLHALIQLAGYVANHPVWTAIAAVMIIVAGALVLLPRPR